MILSFGWLAENLFGCSYWDVFGWAPHFHQDGHFRKPSTQYLGLAFYIVLEAIIFLPMIFMAVFMTEGISVIYQASIMTLALFNGLTVVAFVSNKDFSFLRNILVIGGFLSLGAIVAGAIFGFELGLWFSVAMIALASGSILYQTQNLKYSYGNEQYVGQPCSYFHQSCCCSGTFYEF